MAFGEVTCKNVVAPWFWCTLYVADHLVVYVWERWRVCVQLSWLESSGASSSLRWGWSCSSSSVGLHDRTEHQPRLAVTKGPASNLVFCIRGFVFCTSFKLNYVFVIEQLIFQLTFVLYFFSLCWRVLWLIFGCWSFMWWPWKCFLIVFTIQTIVWQFPVWFKTVLSL